MREEKMIDKLSMDIISSRFGRNLKSLLMKFTNSDTAFVNAIRRACVDTCKCYSLTETINIENINTIFPSLNIDPLKQHCVISSTCGNVEQLSLRMACLALNSDMDSENYSNVYFIVCSQNINKDINEENISKALINTKNEDLIINAWDLLVVKVTHENSSTAEVVGAGAGAGAGVDTAPAMTAMTAMSQTKTKFTLLNSKDYFKYNTHLFTIRYGQYIHVIAHAKEGFNYDNAAWMPCSNPRYRIVPQKEVELADAKPTNDPLSLPGKVWKMKMDYENYGMFQSPKYMELRLAYNGVLPVDKIIKRSVSYLIKQVTKFKNLYQRSTTEHGFVNNVLSTKEGCCKAEQIIIVTDEKIQMNDDDENDEIGYIGDFTVGNLVSSYLLKKVMSLIIKESKESNDPNKTFKMMIEHCKIGMKKAHPLDNNIIIYYHLPGDITSSDKFQNVKLELMNVAIEAIITDLNAVLKSVDSDESITTHGWESLGN